MNGVPQTPRLRSAYPQTPPRNPRDGSSAAFARRSQPVQTTPLPQIPTLKSQPSAPPSEPLIPETLIEAPQQRLYAFALWVLFLSWRLYDFSGLQESEEQSLWLFMKWVAIDGVFLFGLPSLRIPWLEWSSPTMTLIFLAHAVVDGMLMFRVPIPIGAGFAFLWSGIWGAYETAVTEHSANPDRIMFNDSLILGRQVIHILPEGSAVLNPDRDAFCIDHTRTEARLPIRINATNPIEMYLMRVDLDTEANETYRISKSQIKTMHREASRLLSYSDKPNEPKTLYYSVKKPGLYVLEKVMDETNLEVSRKQLAHTVVVPCPKAELLSNEPNRCRGELSDVSIQVTGTPPMRVKFRTVINKSTHDLSFDNLQPDDLVSPLMRQNQNSLVVPRKVEVEWAKARTVTVPLTEGMSAAGTWTYAVDEIADGFGNTVSYSTRDQQEQERHPARFSGKLHQDITVHERPNVNLQGCTPQNPLKVAEGHFANLPLQYGSTGRGAIQGTAYILEYKFSPQIDLGSNGEHGTAPRIETVKVGDSSQLPQIKEPGLYTLTGVSTEFCRGDVLEPASCLLQNPPKPKLAIADEAIFDKCAGSPIGLRVDLDMIGTPPFEISYRITRKGDGHHYNEVEKVGGLRGQLNLTPNQAGMYTYEFLTISDAVYKGQRLDGFKLEQSVKPSASAKFVQVSDQVGCIDEQAKARVALVGEAPFRLEWELVHGGKRKKFEETNITASAITLETEPLVDGGDYRMGLISITDRLGCKEFLQDETKVTIRHQKPKVAFGMIDGRRIVDTLEGKQVALPLRLAGEGPWSIKYLDHNGRQQSLNANSPNDRLSVDHEGMYKLVDVSDKTCPGVVEESAQDFQVTWIPRPELRIAPQEIKEQKGRTVVKEEVCEGDEDAVEVLFKGSPPYHLSYTQSVKPEHGAVAPKNKDLRAALNLASLRMDTTQAGSYEYKFTKLEDSNYDHSAAHFTPLTIQQKVNARPSAAFANPGKTYGFCSVESDGEEVIPVTLHGVAPFELEVEIKHHGSVKPELVSYNNIATNTHSIRIPHSRLHLGKSAVSLRRVSDARGCARTLDSTTPRVQISVHDAPTITPLETHTDYCVGDRINFALTGFAPFTVYYTFEDKPHRATLSSGSNTFRRLAEKPGTFTITGLSDSASSCRSSTNLTKQIHGMPSVRVSRGKDSYVDIHEGGQAEILFEFGGEPPFEFTYTRSANTDQKKGGGGGGGGAVLDMRSEVSPGRELRLWASEEGTYEVVAVKDKFCAYTKPGVKAVEKKDGARKRLGGF
ncbi:related to nuclear pore membrane POM152 [Lecanosticta acicola]|uniref:Related to nuclear pore membrane POM152 n=1 Tax=Lecanosticta acicola TaxID=111012 RepID=A0AAI8Z4I7_9PEZI|nr:related to nuclear pore membrane POM152 [Lecanosticta acicola]